MNSLTRTYTTLLFLYFERIDNTLDNTLLKVEELWTLKGL